MKCFNTWSLLRSHLSRSCLENLQPGTSAWDLIPVILTRNSFFTLQTTNHISNRFEVLTNTFFGVSPQNHSAHSHHQHSPVEAVCLTDVINSNVFTVRVGTESLVLIFLVTFNVSQLFLNCQTFSKWSQDYLAYKDIKAKLGDVGLILKLFKLISPALALPMNT